ncbi:MAG: type II secretion system protein GspD, partial [Planctomycetota bacterium]
EENIPFILEVLNFLDSPRQQVMLEAAVWEVTDALDTQLGAEVSIAKREGGRTFFELFHSRFDTQAFINALTAGQPFQGGTLEFVNTADGHEAKIDIVLQFLQTRGYADLVAQPRMRVMAGEIARIFTGTQIPFSERLKVQGTRREFEVKYREVGVQLDILPTLVGQDEIEVVLVPSVSEVGGFTDSAVTGVSSPIIISRRAATKVRVGNRELITIGGLDQKRTLVSESKVPILGDIPLIKYLFRYKREIKKNIQVWFTVRPTIAGEAERIILPELTGVR